MTTKYRRGQMRDRATHLHLVSQAAGDEFAEPWMSPPPRRRPVHGGYPDDIELAAHRREQAAIRRLDQAEEQTRTPLFDKCPRASAAIGVALLFAVGVMAWLLATGR